MESCCLISEGEIQGKTLGVEDQRNPGGTGCARAFVCACARALQAEPLVALPPGQTSGSSRADGVSVRTYSC